MCCKGAVGVWPLSQAPPLGLLLWERGRWEGPSLLGAALIFVFLFNVFISLFFFW